MTTENTPQSTKPHTTSSHSTPKPYTAPDHSASASRASQPGLLAKITKSSFIQEFKEFINRGSVVDLAIGVAVGGAFTAIVKSLVDDIIMPISSLLAGGLDFSSLSLDVPNFFGADSVAHIAYGNFLQNVINFLLVAFVIFIIVRAMNRLNRTKDAEEAKAEAAAEAKHITDTARAQAKANVEAEADYKAKQDAKAAKEAKKTSEAAKSQG